MQRERGWELRLVRDLEIDGEPVRPSEDTVLTTSPFLLESGPSLLDILRLSFHTDLSQAPPTSLPCLSQSIQDRYRPTHRRSVPVLPLL
jgi:hypothetical protein